MENKRRTTKEQRYYNRGVIEGYLGVELEDLTNAEADLINAYKDGKQAGISKREKLMSAEGFNESQFQERRIGYIKSMGQLVAIESYPASSEKLNANDKQNFEKGYAEGMQLIAGQITNSNVPIEEKKHSR